MQAHRTVTDEKNKNLLSHHKIVSQSQRGMNQSDCDMDGEMKTLELDKVCRVCLTTKKDMRPLFGEMVAEMLMEVARIQVSFVC